MIKYRLVNNRDFKLPSLFTAYSAPSNPMPGFIEYNVLGCEQLPPETLHILNHRIVFLHSLK